MMYVEYCVLIISTFSFGHTKCIKMISTCFIIMCRELIELDRNKLSQQNTQLFADLEKCRETVQSKNKENLKVRKYQR
jgi:hypothetical protein